MLVHEIDVLWAPTAVGAVFIQYIRQAAHGGGREAPLKATGKGARMGTKGDKRRLKRWSQRLVVTTNYDEGENDKEVGDSDEELIAAAERDFKRLACVHTKTLMACVELGRTLSRKVNPDAFLFKATKGS
jgi:hypothetical protein